MKIHDIEPGFITFGGARSPWSDKSLGFRRTPGFGYPLPVPELTGAATCPENCATLGTIRGGTASEAGGGVGQHEVRSDVFGTLLPSGSKTPDADECSCSNSIKAPIPGVIVEIKVKEGEKVTKGMTVAVIEAMKMENDILAESDGTVTAVKAAAGAAVLEGDTIMIIG